eukprot:jgi/Chlat1/9202/Chrsp97S08471
MQQLLYASASCGTPVRSAFFGVAPAQRPGRRCKHSCSELSVRKAAVRAVAQAGGSSMRVAVLGAGVIGAATAYFLSEKGAEVIVIERHQVACAASGKAGGFLAKDWCDGSPLAETLGEDYGYRKVTTYSVAVVEGAQAKGRSKSAAPSWVDGPVQKSNTIGTETNTAQVHPELFTKALIRRAEQNGATVRIGEVKELRLGTGIEGAQKLTGVVVDDDIIEVDAAVVAMGPWSSRLVSDICQITGLKAHSIVLAPKDSGSIGSHALFLAYGTKEGQELEPEIYPRPNGQVYVCGMSEEVPVPEDPAQVLPTKGKCEKLQQIATSWALLKWSGSRHASYQYQRMEFRSSALCLGVYVGTGHSCWGILNGPATGKSLAELIVDGKSSTVNLKAFDPARFTRRFATPFAH